MGACRRRSYTCRPILPLHVNTVVLVVRPIATSEVSHAPDSIGRMSLPLAIWLRVSLPQAMHRELCVPWPHRLYLYSVGLRDGWELSYRFP